MADQGCTFHMKCSPTKMERTEDGRIKVTWMNSQSESGVECSDVFDTVMLAVGRNADTKKLGLETAGVKTAANGKFDCVQERTNVPHIFAIGDVVNGGQELTPVAIQAGNLLAKRLFTGSSLQMDYDLVPTTVFTPLEYGACGLGEEEAIERYGANNIEVYWKRYLALEMAATHRTKANGEEIANPHMSKLVCHKGQNERVIGFHYLGPNAGEV